MPLISIIIPVYNVEKYLNECLDSIINQTYTNLEIICIDNASADSCPSILDKFAQKDERIKLFTSEIKEEVGKIRNKGLDLMHGKYLMFVDPDDYLNPDSIEILIKELIKTNAQVLEFPHKGFVDNTNYEYVFTVKNYLKLKNIDIVDKGFYTHKDIPFSEVRFACWHRVYSVEFLRDNNIRFAPINLGEDNLFAINAVLSADKIYYVDECVYNYRRRPNSLCHRQSKDAFDFFDMYISVKKLLEKKKLIAEYKNVYEEYKLNQITAHYYNCPPQLTKKYLKRTKKSLNRKQWKQFLKSIDKENLSTTFWQNLFSTGNEYSNSGKYKVIRFLGFKIKFKITVKNTK